MWLYISGILALGLILQVVRVLGKWQRNKLEALEEESDKLDKKTAKVDNEINRLTLVGNGVERFKMKELPQEFIGVDSGANTVAEHTNEYPNEITGHRVDVWIYAIPINEEPMKIIVAGHANGPVCREVSAALSTAYHRRERIDEDDFFVTGAGVLVNNELPNTRNQDEFLKAFLEAKQKGEITSLTELARQLQTYQKITGLVNVHISSITEYRQTIDGILNKIKQIFASGQSGVFGDNSPEKDGLLIDIPFFRLENKQLKPLTITIYESELDCEEFQVLRERHRKALMQEMKEDVKRRNRIYKEWLEKDETKEKQLSRHNQFEMIRLSGYRDYEKGEVIESSSYEEITIKEYREKHLKVLIEDDKRWIQRTQFELERLEKHEKEAGLASNLNYTLLIDSFLRGWPSIFFSNENERQLYDKWLELKRENVWKKVCENLLEQGINPTNILHTNIVFKVKNRKGDQIKIEPRYFLLTNAYMVSVDCKNGFVRYVHPWEHREYLHLIVDGKRIPDKDLTKYTDSLINEGLKLIDSEQIDLAKQYFLLALRCHAEPAFLKITSHWWNNLSKDTSAMYKDRVSDPYLNALFTGLSLPHDPSRENIESRKSELQYCIETKPEALPDPYIYHAVLEVYKDYIDDRKSDQKRFEKLAEERMLKAKEDFLANKFLPEVTQSGFVTTDEFKKLMDPKFSSFSDLYAEKERIFEKAFFQGYIMRLKEMDYFECNDKYKKVEMSNKALKDIEKYDFIKMAISYYARGEIEAQTEDKRIPSLFERMKSNVKSKEYLDKARKIDNELVENILKEEQFRRSDNFWKTVGSFSEIAKANKFVELNNWIVEILEFWEKYPDTKTKMEISLNNYNEIKFPLNPQEEVISEKLTRVVEQLRKFMGESIDNLYLPLGELRSIQADLLNFAAKLYKETPIYDLMEGNKARVLIASQNHSAYKEAIKIMLEPGRSLRLLTREIEGEIINPTLKNLDDIITLDCIKNNGKAIISAKKINGESNELLVLTGLTEEDFTHISNYFSDDDWKKKIRPLGDNVGEMLLNTPMPHVPRVQRFADILSDPEISSILVHIMAYSNQHLVTDRIVEIYYWLKNVHLRTTADGYVVGDIKVDFQKIYNKTMQSF